MSKYRFAGISFCFLLAVLLSCSGNKSTGVSPTPLSFRLAASGFSSPVHMTNANDGSNRLFVVERGGAVRIVKSGTVQLTPFLDISTQVSSAGEQGLLSIAFPPQAGAKTHFYVYYTDMLGNIVISRFLISSNPDVADAASEERILTIAHPQFTNHYGGQLAFGSDRQLYAGIGDGGGGGDPFNNSQNPASNLGKMLRINVEDRPGPYAPQIWAMGLRNPWRFSFDSLTGDLFIGDVGQNLYEEVDVQSASSVRGENYGWNIMEGFHCYNAATCIQTGLMLPVVEYDHTQGCAITGGHVYRGSLYPALYGNYLYGDFCSGRIWGLMNTQNGWQSTLLSTTTFTITSFGLDEMGNIYVVDYSGGGIYLIAQP